MGGENALSGVGDGRRVLEADVFEDHLALARLAGEGAAWLVSRGLAGCWIIASSVDPDSPHAISAQRVLALAEVPDSEDPELALLPVHAHPDLWLCVPRSCAASEAIRRVVSLLHQTVDTTLVKQDAALHRLATEAEEIGFFRWSAQDGKITGDSHFSCLLGLSADQTAQGVSLRTLLRVVHPEDRMSFLRDLRDGLEEEGRSEYRLRVAARGGDTGQPRQMRSLLVRGRRTQDWDRTGAGYSGLIMDVTAAAATEEALRSSETFMRLLLATSPDFVKIIDREGRIRFVSEGGLRTYEMDNPVALHGVLWADRWKGRGRRDVENALERAWRGESSRFQGYSDTMKGNRRFWDVALVPIANEETGVVDRVLTVSRDMTQVDQAAERLKLALDSGAIAGTWMWNDHTGRVAGDGRLAATFGLNETELADGVPSSVFYDLIDARDRAHIYEVIGKIRETGGACRFEFRARVAGRSHWYESSGYRDLLDESGGFRFSGIVTDIDGRKRHALRQAALVELGDGLRALSAPEGMASLAASILCRELGATGAGYANVAPDGLVAAVASDLQGDAMPGFLRNTHRLSDYGPQQSMLEHDQPIALDDIHASQLPSRIREQLYEEGVFAFLTVPLFKFGHLVGIMMVYFNEPHQWSEEDIVFTRAVADRTHAAMRQARTQNQLVHLNEVLEARVIQRTRERDRLWSVANDLLAIIDREGFYTSISPSWQRGLGYAPDDLIGCFLETVCHPMDRVRVAEVFQEMQAGETRAALDVRMTHTDGSVRLYNWVVLNENDEFYAIGRDITERMELEEQLRQAQKMEAVGQLTGGLAHDFNNLLAGIGGGLELVTKRIAQGRTTGLERYIDGAQDAVKRAASLTHRLLAFSRRQTLDPQPTGINGLIVNMRELLQGTVGPSVSLTTDLQSDLWQTRVDANQLENALLNLCINGRDAMAESGGAIRITTCNKVLDRVEGPEIGLPPGDYVMVTVRDTGQGMSPEVSARAFDPFFTTKPMGQGTGLGLSMIYGFVRQSGGHVRIWSREGEGTEVRLVLPRYVPDGETDTAPAQHPLSLEPVTVLNGAHVLVVDDEPALRLLVRETVEDMGGVVQIARNGAQALALLEQEGTVVPDILITDIGMPGGLNGLQLAERVRLRWPEVKVLFITGYAEQGALNHQWLDDRTAVLVKPFSLEALGPKLAGLMGAVSG